MDTDLARLGQKRVLDNSLIELYAASSACSMNVPIMSMANELE